VHATVGSRATFDFPQNSFVWEIKKIDSRPPKRATDIHDFFPSGGQINQLETSNKMLVFPLPSDAGGRRETGLKFGRGTGYAETQLP